MTAALLRRIEATYDAIPRDAGSHADDVGPLVVFHSSRPLSPSYARPVPVPGAPFAGLPFTAADVDAARARQRELGVTETLEWIDEVAPSLEAAAITSGFRVERCPLMVLDPERLPPEPSDGVRLLDPASGDFELCVAASWAVAELAFGGEDGGPTERDSRMAAVDPARAVAAAHAHAVGRLRMAVAEVPGAGVTASGLWQSGCGAAEIVAVATLSSYRGRGLGTSVTAALARSALAAGNGLVFLSAADDRVAAMYARIGFTRVGTACIAELD